MTRSLPTARRAPRWAGVLALAALILVVSVLDPGRGGGPSVFGVRLSVTLHVVAYGGLTVAVGDALCRADRRALLVAAAGAVCFGIGVELVQAPLPYRTASAIDVLVNAAGAGVGAMLWRSIAPVVARDRRDAGTTSI